MKNCKYRILILMGSFLIPVLPLSAQWEKIDDFESTEGFWDRWAMNVNEPAMINLAIVDTIPDPLDPDNSVLFFNPNAYETNIWDQTSLFNTVLDPIPDGTQATWYFRFFKTGNNVNGVFGFISERTPEPVFDFVGERRVITEPNIGWTQYEAYMGPRGDNDPTWDIYDTNGFRRISDANIGAGYWFEFWQHMNNAPGAVGTDEYAVYVRRSDEAEPRLLLIPSSDGTQFYETALFRTQMDFAITTWGISLTMGNPAERNAGNPIYFDDFHIDYSGLNLDRPEGVTVPEGQLVLWNALPMTESGGFNYVDTGDQMGWLMVDWDPYLWSTSLSSWIVIEDFKPFGSLWTYVWPKADGTSPIPQPTDPEKILSDPEDPESPLVDGDLVYVLVPGLNKWAYVPAGSYAEGAPMWAFFF